MKTNRLLCGLAVISLLATIVVFQSNAFAQTTGKDSASGVAPVLAAPHKVLVPDPATARRILANGGRLLADYGGYQLYAVQTITPDLAGEARAEVRDDFDRIAYGSMTTRGELVFGGGSNAAYGYGFGNGTAYRGDPAKAMAAIARSLERYLPKARSVRIARRWTGPVALTMSRVCTMGVQGKHRNVYFALGYSGHGVTLANLAGEVLTDIYAGDDARWHGLPFFQQRLLFVPPEPFRWVGYHAYTGLTGRSPRRAL